MVLCQREVIFIKGFDGGQIDSSGLNGGNHQRKETVASKRRRGESRYRITYK